MTEVKLLYHKHRQIIKYQYGKKGPILTSMNTSHLSQNTAKYFGFNSKDSMYLVSGLLSKNVEIFAREKCCTIIPNTRAYDHNFHQNEIELLRYGVGVRVLDFIWVTRGSVYNEFGKVYSYEFHEQIIIILNFRWIL